MRTALDWFFRDRRTGRIVVGQWPNLPLWLFAAAAALDWTIDLAGLPVAARILAGLRVVGAVALAWWACDEVLRGVNPWRRCLGGVVLIFLILRVAAA